MCLVSFIVPVYNVGQYLENCIESLLQQTIKGYEIILIDDGSTDNSWEICCKYVQNYVNVIAVHQNNCGVSAARNKGMELASGRWFVFVDSDDYLALNFLEICLKNITDDTDICFFEYKEIESENKFEVLSNVEADNEITYFQKTDFDLFIRGGFNRDIPCKYDFHKIKLAMPGKMYSRSLIMNDNVRFPVGVKTGEDLLFNLNLYRIAQKGIYIAQGLYFHRGRESSVSRAFSKNAQEDYMVLLQHLDSFLDQFDNRNAYIHDFSNKAMVSLGFTVVLYFCHKKNTKSYSVRRNEFLEYWNKDIFQKARLNIKLSEFRVNKKVLCILLKYRQFLILDVLIRTGLVL